jgi:heme iron utilization protein
MNRDEHAYQMLNLLGHQGDGVLSTISLEIEGYPFGSITPYCLDREFRPNILISSLAQHTKNILANPKVSLLVSERESQTNKQALGRLTYLGQARLVEDEHDIKARYLRYFPEAQAYFQTHDFAFYQIQPVRVRFIGGFGKIFWVEPAALQLVNIFSAEEEKAVVEHMNSEHLHNLKDYAHHYLHYPLMEADAIHLAGLDQFGLDLIINKTKFRIEFPQQLTNSRDVRSVMVEMAKAAKSTKGELA